jgi:hypothetical protein
MSQQVTVTDAANNSTVIDRETWLSLAWVITCKYTGIDPEEPHISVGFPISPHGGRQRLRTMPSQLVPGQRSADGIKHIFVSPSLAGGADAIAALLWLIKDSRSQNEQDLKDGYFWVPDPPSASANGRNERIPSWLASFDQLTRGTVQSINKEVVAIAGVRYEDLHSAIKNNQRKTPTRPLKKLFGRACGWIAYATRRNVPWVLHQCPVGGSLPIGGTAVAPRAKSNPGDVDLTPSQPQQGAIGKPPGSTATLPTLPGDDSTESDDEEWMNAPLGKPNAITDDDFKPIETGDDSGEEPGEEQGEPPTSQESAGSPESPEPGDSESKKQQQEDAASTSGDSDPSDKPTAGGQSAPSAPPPISSTTLSQLMQRLRTASNARTRPTDKHECDDPTCVVCANL